MFNTQKAFWALHFVWTDSVAVLFFCKVHQKWLHMGEGHLSGWWRGDCPTGFWSLELQISTLKHQSYKIKPHGNGAEKGKTLQALQPTQPPPLTCPGCTAPQDPCWGSTTSSLHWLSNSITKTSRRSRGFWLLSLRFKYFHLKPPWKLTRQLGVCACFTRQKSSYL